MCAKFHIYNNYISGVIGINVTRREQVWPLNEEYLGIGYMISMHIHITEMHSRAKFDV